MLNGRIVLFIASLLMAGNVSADLTGQWSCDDGGTYYLRQIGKMVYWYGERDKDDPAWSNVFNGHVNGDKITGSWFDVPKGHAMGRGTLTLTIHTGGNTITAAHKTGGFGGSKWTRLNVSATPPAQVQQSCLISGRITGQINLVKYVSISGPNMQHATTPVVNGAYSFNNIAPGNYTLRPVAGGKFSVDTEPRQRNIACTGETVTNNDFSILGIQPGSE